MRLVHTLAMIGSPILILFAAALESGHHANPTLSPDHSIQANLPLPPKVAAILRRSCSDCHSSETRWPWYSQLPGVGSLVARDVAGGREAMNFSEWSVGAGRTPLQAGAMLLAACEAVRQHRMPKPNYLFLHADAELSKADIDELCTWAKSEATELVQANR